MKESRHILHLVLEALPAAKQEEVRQLAAKSQSEVFLLTEANSAEALEKIFAADAVTVWSPLVDENKGPAS